MKKRLKKIALILGLILGVLVAAGLITNAIAVYITDKQLEERLAKLAADGAPLTLAQLAPDPLPPDDNAAVFMQSATPRILALLKQLNPVLEKDSYKQGVWDEADNESVQAAFEAFPDVMPLLVQAANCCDYASLQDFSVAPSEFMSQNLEIVQDYRASANLLRLRSRWLVAQGKGEEALESGKMILKFSEHLEQEPMLVAYLVALAIRSIGIVETNRVLRSASIGDEARIELDAQLALFDDSAAYRNALRREIAIGRGHLGEQIPSTWFLRAVTNRHEIGYLDVTQQYLDLAERPLTETMALSKKLRAEAAGAPSLGLAIVPALEKVSEAHGRVQCSVRCLRVLNALQGRLQQNPKLDLNISELVLPAEAVTDPYSGKPLILKRVTGAWRDSREGEPFEIAKPDGDWVVYSLGRNQKDDGGSVHDLKDFGLGPVRPIKN